MVFTARRADGTTEQRAHVPYTIHATGNAWEARDARDGRLMVRNYISEDACRASADTITEPA